MMHRSKASQLESVSASHYQNGEVACQSRVPAAPPQSSPRAARATLGLLLALSAGLAALEPSPLLADALDSCRVGVQTGDPALDAALKSLTLGKPASAASQLRTLATQRPTDPRVLYHLARAELARSDRAAALAASQSALRLDPSCGPVALQAAGLLQATGSRGDAIGALQQAVEATPGDTAARKALAQLLILEARLPEAEQHLRWFRDQPPGSAEAQAAWAEVQGWRGLAADAIAGFDAAITLDPSVMSSDRLRTFGEALRQAGDLERAREQVLLALKRSPRDAASHNTLGAIYLALKQPDSALESFRQAVRYQPGRSDYHANLARALHSVKRTEEAIPAYAKAMKLDPANDELVIEAAQVVGSLPTQRDRAIDSMMPLARRSPPDLKHVLVMAEIMSWQPSRREEALGWLEQVLTSEPGSEDAWRLARQTVLWMEPEATLLPRIAWVRGHFPDDPALVMHAASSLSRAPGQEAAATALFGKVLEVQPDNAEARIARAELLLKTQPDQSNPIADELVRAAASSDRPDLQARAAGTLMRLGRYSEALTCYAKGIDLDPSHPGCLVGMVTVLSTLEKYPEARAAADRGLALKLDKRTRAELEAEKARVAQRAERADATALLRSGKLAEAEALWSRIARQYPRDIDVWLSLGAIQSGRNDFVGALKSFRLAHELAPQNVGALQGLSGSLTALERFPEALKFVQAEAKVAPSPDVERRLRLLQYRIEAAEARALVNAGRSDDALAMLSRLYLSHPEELEVIRLYGELLVSTRRYAQAAEVLERGVQASPDDPGMLLGLANARWGLGQRVKAREALLRARNLLPLEERSRLNDQLLGWEVAIGEDFKARGDLARALEQYALAYRIDPRRDYVLKGIAGLYWSNRQLDLASKYYVRVSQLHPEDLEAIEGAARTLIERGAAQAAVALLQNHRQRNRSPLRELLEQAELAQELQVVEAAFGRGDRAIAESLALDAVRNHPSSIEPYLVLARLHGQKGSHTEAVGYYQRALEIKPDDQSALLALIASLQAMGRYTESADLIRQMRELDSAQGRVTLELDPLEAASWAARGNFLRERGDFPGALEAFQEAIHLGLDAPWLFVSVAQLYADNQQHRDALVFYELALEGDPEDVLAIRGQAVCLLALGQLERAQSLAAALVAGPDATPRDRLLVAEVRKREGSLEEAIDIYRGLYQEFPGELDVVRGYSGVLLEAKRPHEALTVLNQSLPDLELDRLLLMSTAAALRGLYSSDLAVPVYRKLARSWPSPEADALVEEAMIGTLVEHAETAKSRQDHEQARLLYLEGRRRAPRNLDVLRGQAGVEAASGDLEKALEFYEQVLEVAPDDPIGISGHAVLVASRGDNLSALEELETGWSRTRHPRIGLEWVKLLEGLGRTHEASLVLRQVERELGVSALKQERALEKARQPAHHELAEPVARFEQIWPRVARHSAPPEAAMVVTETLPLLTVERLQGRNASGRWTSSSNARWTQSQSALDKTSTAETVHEDGDAPPATVARIVLPDVDPALPVPTLVGELSALKAAPEARDRSRVNLWLVDQLMRDLRNSPVEDRSRVSSPASGGTSRTERAWVNPWLDERAPARSRVTASSQTSRSGQDEDAVADYSAYRPVVTQQPLYSRHIPPTWDGVAEAETLRRRIDLKVAGRIYLGGMFVARTGSAGSTFLLGAFADLRLGLGLGSPPALHLEPFVAPGMITDAVEFQQGTSVGVRFQSHPGPFWINGRIGSTPIGFLGGVAPDGELQVGLEAANRLRLSAEGGIEPVQDSLLSWAGQVEEDSGQVHGFVSRTRGGATLGLALDGDTELTLGGDVARYQGIRTEENRWRQGRMDLTHRLSDLESSRLSLRVKGVAFGFAAQLDGFELGEGGYFSPEFFLVVAGGVIYESLPDAEHLRYRIEVNLGGQYVQGEASESLSPGARAVIEAQAEAAYAVSSGFELGVRYQFDNAGADYTRNAAWIYLSKRFGGQRRPDR